MGCLFSKLNARDQVNVYNSAHVQRSMSNGLVRITKPKHTGIGDGSNSRLAVADLDNETDNYTHDSSSPSSTLGHRNMKPVSVTPRSFSRALIQTPVSSRPQTMEPPTLEESKKILFLQNAQDVKHASVSQNHDLAPNTAVKSNFATVDPHSSHPVDKKIKDSLSNATRDISLIPSIRDEAQIKHSKKGTQPAKTNIIVEDIDTEVDSFSGSSGTRYVFKGNAMKNTSATDILLPRIKERVNKTTGEISVVKPTLKRSKKEYNINIVELAYVDNENISATNGSKERNEALEQCANDQKTHILKDSSNESYKMLQPFEDHDYEKVIGLPRSEILLKDKTAARQKNESPKTLHEKDLAISRKNRKRIHRLTKHTDETHKNTGHLGMQTEAHLAGSLKQSIKHRPSSGTSIWTMNSKASFGSNDTLKSFDINPQTDVKTNNQYSYIATESTPISFKAVGHNEEATIVDLEENDYNNQNDSWLNDDEHNKFDGWFGVKPYQVINSSMPSDSSYMKGPMASEPTSSEVYTKQKLLFSRFARRPYSETTLGMSGKPPIPPGSEFKLRPTSETVRKPETFSRYFTTDLDIH